MRYIEKTLKKKNNDVSLFISLHTYLSNHKTKATKTKAKRQTQRVTGAQDSGQTN